MAPQLSVVVPVYNEAALIEQTLRRVIAAAPQDKEILVVDDGSTDGTREVLGRVSRELPVRVLLQERNRGKGAALRRGFAEAQGEIVLIQDADQEYDPADYPALIGPIARGEADAVLGSRFVNQQLKFFTPGGAPFFSHYVGNKIIIWVTNVLYGFHATDYEGGYKAFRRSVLREIPVEADGFEFDNELVCKLLRRKKRIAEVPIRYTAREYGQGKKIRWYHGVRMLWSILKWRVTPF